ncbi:metal ABC transporter ATP-binding protein [Ferrimonas balearica]|uniref:metal ABC transporter ATP-binding protein n=1 Tax=Ferrimonas balearica TaxID=44012 RepID=UPI001C58D4D6|nr:metal ABC transporter ATP-binding protein [Ferrimonas balearica]MBY6016466.1 metal ABC transporter ATP-binding protein [Halomonas denitrificans]MBW3138889.1 metal ABC transporter ATP-binding protein [Ferrimonas balearica]MBY5979672.1 metal ABC transporter ATP-binding protein [Ferrimonas balearica]MBY6095263.1 metal ABC transporter ATP-binding protein [Ferrimonas balearica]MBY6105952.1 metal ABC transporter ATP-binding protein [Ferrimonas balearica]
MSGPSIELTGLSLQYGPERVLSDIDHTFEAGCCHVLMGPNGGGKTSLLRSILGLTPFTGDITIHWPDRPGAVGYVPQSAAFESSLPLTVMDFVLLNLSRRPLFWRRASKERQQVLAQLERVGMAERADRRMGQLSGGEQQRVLFAQALLDQPQLLILDEPTTGMDETGVRYLDDLIADLNQRGCTLMCVHHDVGAVRRLPNPMVHVVNREIVDSGPADQVLAPHKLANLFQHHSRKVA